MVVFKSLGTDGFGASTSPGKERNHNPRVGGSRPSSATISVNIIGALNRFKNDFEAIFALHTFWLAASNSKLYRFYSD